jgi:hypothetical protein
VNRHLCWEHQAKFAQMGDAKPNRRLGMIDLWGLGLSGVAILLALAAIALDAHWRVNWGIVGQWAGALASFTAAGIALGIAVYNTRRSRLEQEAKTVEQRQRALRRAQRVLVLTKIESITHESRRADYEVQLKNNSGATIYQVKLLPPMIVVRDASGAKRLYRANDAWMRDSAERATEAPAVALKHGETVAIAGSVSNQWEDRRLYAIVCFEDGDGYRFGRTVTGTPGVSPLFDDALTEVWEIVDDNWPNQSSGPLRELLDQADGQEPTSE